VEEGVQDHAKEIAQSAENAGIEHRKEFMVHQRPVGCSRADDGSSYGSNSKPDSSRVVNQVHGLDVVAGVMRLDVLQESTVVASQGVVCPSQEIAVAEGVPAFQLDFEPGSGGKMLDGAPVCFLPLSK